MLLLFTVLTFGTITSASNECIDLFGNTESAELLKLTRESLGCDSMELLCNGIPDNEICSNPLVGKKQCSKILLDGRLNVNEL